MIDNTAPAPPLEIGSVAPDVVLHGPDGAEIALSRLWEARPAVLVFLRHFG